MGGGVDVIELNKMQKAVILRWEVVAEGSGGGQNDGIVKANKLRDKWTKNIEKYKSYTKGGAFDGYWSDCWY